MKKIVLVLIVIFFIGTIIFLYRHQSKSLSPITQPTTRPFPTTNQPIPYKLEIYATNLTVPWSILFTSPTRILVPERPGEIREIISGKVTEQPLITFTEVSSIQEEGLMGLEKDPNYVTNHYLYASLSYPKNNGYVDKVIRLVDEQTSIRVDKILLDNIPAAQVHAGSRVKFGPDGKLYITTGDGTQKARAQDMDFLGGKILRMNSDGTIPSDNPFPNSYIYSLGHRNSQGIAWYPGSNSMYEVEHGPSGFDGAPGGDEINYIVPKGNYGWPLVSHTETKDGFMSPIQVYTPAIAPASAMIYSGKIFPQFRNQLFYGGLVGKGLFHAVINDQAHTITSQEKFPDINVGRIRDVEEGPDGYIYFSTSNKDGRGTPSEGDDKIYRLISQN